MDGASLVRQADGAADVAAASGQRGGSCRCSRESGMFAACRLVGEDTGVEKCSQHADEFERPQARCLFGLNSYVGN